MNQLKIMREYILLTNLIRSAIPIILTRFWAMSLPFVDSFLLSYASADSLNHLSLSIPISQFFYLVAIGLLGSAITFLRDDKINDSELITSSIGLGFGVSLLGCVIGVLILPKYFIPITLCSINAGIAVYIYISTIIIEYKGAITKCLKINFYCFFINLFADIYFIFYCNFIDSVNGCLLATLVVRLITVYMLNKEITYIDVSIRLINIVKLLRNSITFSIKSGLFYMAIMMIIYIESLKLNVIDFATFNMLLNITNFSFVIFIGLNISIQIFIKKSNESKVKILGTSLLAVCVFIIILFLILACLITVSNNYLQNFVLDNILHNYMSIMCLLNIISEGFLGVLVAYLTSVNKHGSQNIIKIVLLYLFIGIMVLFKQYNYVFLYIFLANLLTIAIVYCDIRRFTVASPYPKR